MSAQLNTIRDDPKNAPSDLHHFEKDKKPFSGPRSKEARQALQTFFRSSFRVQMGMVSLADRKANILVRLNSLLISGMVIFYKNIISLSDLATITVVVFLVTLVASLIFATLAVRPSSENRARTDQHNPVESVGQMFMYTHYVDMDPEEFEISFNTMMQDAGLIYGSMARDLYSFGKIIEKKYTLLKLAYTTFTVGLVITVILFLSTILVS